MSARTCLGFLALLAVGCGGESTGPRLPVVTIEIAPVGDVWVGDARPVLATLRDANGAALTRRTIAWSSSNDAVASVDATGVMTARAVGMATITASSEGKQNEIAVVVSDLDLLYEGFLFGPPEMLVLPLGGGEPTRVLPAGMTVTGPVASPDGTMIAFVARADSNSNSNIFVVHRAGTGLLQLTSAPETDDNPSWSPDGTKIAFRSFRAGRRGDIWVMNADGSNPVNITPDASQDSTDDRRPAWSPDGTRIAFSSNRGGTFDIWTMRADGSERVQLTNTLQFDTEPTWSPDGTRIAFRRSDDFTSDMMIVFATGGDPQRLALAGHELMPSWSPKGDVLAFAYFAPGVTGPQIYTIRPDGSGLTLRTTNSEWKGGIEPRWIRR